MIDIIFAVSAGISTPFIASKINKFGKIKLFCFGFVVGLFFSLISAFYYHFFGLQNFSRGFDFYTSPQTIIPGLIFPFSFGIMAALMQLMYPLMTWKQAERKILRSGFAITKIDNLKSIQYSKGDFDLIAIFGQEKVPTRIKIFRGKREIGLMELKN
ncbi:hypothetical protein HG421_07370 [Xanthomonas campestris pv. badrii]|uniref:Uncharacterized protein n=1 Tax=Xanthomonas campestris pv. badrii TaxID=149696 RepID=A0A7Z2ZGY4_XANCA|nr:hypothetical protein [Xanthomonas campestris]QJD67557.1 hypothetical protein HG421_07370 [Xanthomonas campestris pv. badrii]